MLQLLGDSVPKTPCRDFAPRPLWSLEDCPPQFNLLDPPLSGGRMAKKKRRKSFLN